MLRDIDHNAIKAHKRRPPRVDLTEDSGWLQSQTCVHCSDSLDKGPSMASLAIIVLWVSTLYWGGHCQTTSIALCVNPCDAQTAATARMCALLAFQLL